MTAWRVRMILLPDGDISTAARRLLGFGELQQGEPADLVTYNNDPRDDPAVLDQPAAVFFRDARIK